MPKLRILLLLLAIVIIVIAALLMVLGPSGVVRNESGENITPHISWDDDDVRVWDIVNFTVSGAPHGSNVTWRFTDISWAMLNFTRYGSRVEVEFPHSAVYRVEVVVRSGGREGRDTAEVRVRDRDTVVVGDVEMGNRERVGGVYRTDGGWRLLGPSITYPEMKLNISLHRVTGLVTANLTISHHNDVLYSGETSEMAVMGSVELRFHITPEELAGDGAEEGYEDYLDFNIIVSGAGIADAEVSVYIELHY